MEKNLTHVGLSQSFVFCDPPAVLHRKVFPVDSVTALNKSAGWFVIHRRQGANVTDELVQQGGLNQVCLLWDQGLLRQNHLLGGHRVSGQQTPVNVTSITQVRVVRVLRGSKRWRHKLWSQFLSSLWHQVHEPHLSMSISSFFQRSRHLHWIINPHFGLNLSFI